MKKSVPEPAKKVRIGFGNTLAYLSLAPLLALSANNYGQNGAVSTVLEHYSGLNVERTGPTINAELAQKMYRRGNTYSNLERYEEAIEEYRRAISADPNLADAVRNLANTYYFLERYEEAKPLFARFIELQKETSAGLIAAVSTLGQLEREGENYQSSIQYDLRAIELNPQNDSQVHVMANTYNNAGEAEKAILIYRTAIEIMAKNAFFDRSLGRILEQEGRIEDALMAYEAAAEKDPDSGFYANLVETTRNRIIR